MSKSKVRTNYVTHDTTPRLCRRPARVPGVAPPCHDDKEDYRPYNGWAKRACPVSLPRLAFLEKAKA